MCDCFEKVEANLQEKTGDPNASLNYMYVMPSFEKKPVIEGTYRKKKKDGDFPAENGKYIIGLSFLPFLRKEINSILNKK